MYGIVEIAGHQYRVAAGDLIDVDRLGKEAGSTVEFDQVLFIGGEQPEVGLPTINGAKVTAKVLRHARDKKILVVKRQPGAYTKTRGHRTSFTSLLITEIKNGKGAVAKIDTESKTAKKFLK